MAIDFQDPIGRIRLLIADFDEQNLIFQDDHLQAYLELNSASIHRAAADALDAMATSEVLLSRKIRAQDVQTDGPAVAAELRKQAVALRDKADDVESADTSFFEIIPLGRTKPEATEWGWL